MKKNVLFLAVTNSQIERDERILKECQSLIDLGAKPLIFVVEYANKSRSGYVGSCIPFASVSLLSRKIFSSGRFLHLKALELHLKFAIPVLFRNWNCLWVVDHHPFGIIVLGWIKKLFNPNLVIVWDQHELAETEMVRKIWYKWLIERCRWVISANKYRSEMLVSTVKPSDPSRLLTLENYPNRIHPIVNDDEDASEFRLWLGQDNYCLFQGGAYRHRAIFECVEAVARIPMLKLVVVGPMPEDIVAELTMKYATFSKKVWITGWFNILDLDKYTKNALLSLVFYEPIDLNHWYCAPNRLYHAINRGLPIVCGPNPPMKHIIEKYCGGIVCNSERAQADEIEEAIKKIAIDPLRFRNITHSVVDTFIWENQESIFKQIYHSIAFD